MDKALSPYIAGGGAKKHLKKWCGQCMYFYADADFGKAVGGFQAMTQDALTVLNDVPGFRQLRTLHCLARSMCTLGGIALQGDPDYAIIQAAGRTSSQRKPRRSSPRRGGRFTGGALRRARAATTGEEHLAVPRAGRLARGSSAPMKLERTRVPGGSATPSGRTQTLAPLAKYVLATPARHPRLRGRAVVVADAQAGARRLFDRAASAAGVALRRLPFVGALFEKATPRAPGARPPTATTRRRRAEFSLRVAARSLVRRGPSIEPRRRALRPGRTKLSRTRRRTKRPGRARDLQEAAPAPRGPGRRADASGHRDVGVENHRTRAPDALLDSAAAALGRRDARRSLPTSRELDDAEKAKRAPKLAAALRMSLQSARAALRKGRVGRPVVVTCPIHARICHPRAGFPKKSSGRANVSPFLPGGGLRGS